MDGAIFRKEIKNLHSGEQVCTAPGVRKMWFRNSRCTEGSSYYNTRPCTEKLDRIRAALKANVTALNANKALAEVCNSVKSSKVAFFPRAEATFDGSTIVGDVKSGSVIWCFKYNQGFFDVAFVFNSTLVTIQLSDALTQRLRPKHIKPLCDALSRKDTQIDRVIHVVVIEGGVGFQEATSTISKAKVSPSIDVWVVESDELERYESNQEDNTVEILGGKRFVLS